ncbi:MAG: hypothetical protein OXU61_07855, partial [Gammaproteobacteria bacterium]|nr:hypothetical protein [Gammaproteobacteria bacterium]
RTSISTVTTAGTGHPSGIRSSVLQIVLHKTLVMVLESPDKGNTACALLSDCHIHKAVVEGPSNVLYYIHQT